jgi:hypothetical protein
MSAAADGWTEANLYFDPIPGVKMQTNLQRVNFASCISYPIRVAFAFYTRRIFAN